MSENKPEKLEIQMILTVGKEGAFFEALSEIALELAPILRSAGLRGLHVLKQAPDSEVSRECVIRMSRDTKEHLATLLDEKPRLGSIRDRVNTEMLDSEDTEVDPQLSGPSDLDEGDTTTFVQYITPPGTLEAVDDSPSLPIQNHKQK